MPTGSVFENRTGRFFATHRVLLLFPLRDCARKNGPALTPVFCYGTIFLR